MKGSNKTRERKYGAKASRDVERAMHELKRGSLRSGRAGKKVTSRKQAVAIGLSQARREGAKVPRQVARSSRKSSSKPSRRPKAKGGQGVSPHLGRGVPRRA